jgi:tRNA(fMet)-specific endonuclease VapC
MPGLYLLDTNTVSYVIKGNIPRVQVRLAKVPPARIAISVVTEAELRFGVASRPEARHLRIAVEEFLLRVSILSWDSLSAQHYADLRASLERAGTPIGNLDLMIAAQAIAVDAVLVTNDSALKGIKRLKTEDWTKP